MLNLFYQNKALNDTLIINVSSTSSDKIETKEDVTLGYAKNELVFINIANASKHIKDLKDGLLFPTSELIQQIKQLTGQDLTNKFDNGFKVGLIEQCDDISGTHLHKCKVSIGSKVLDIVCGAPNARHGIKVVVATNGTMLPNGKQIIAGQLLGNKSEGMLCSYRELNINKESKGIIELIDTMQVGDYYKEVYANTK